MHVMARFLRMFWVVAALILVSGQMKAQLLFSERISHGSFDSLSAGTHPNCNLAAGGWQWPSGYPSSVCETQTGQFTIVDTASFEPESEGRSLRMNVNNQASINVHLTHLFSNTIFEWRYRWVWAEFDIWVPTEGVSGGAFYLGAGGYDLNSQRGPAFTWTSGGNLQAQTAGGAVTLAPYEFGQWQHLKVVADLVYDTYDVYQGPRDGVQTKVGEGLPFRSGALDRLDRFTPVFFGSVTSAQSYWDNVSVRVGADCNNNGVHDADDIAAGTSVDCDGNEVPDECELLAARAYVVQNSSTGISFLRAVDLNDIGGPAPIVAALPPTENNRGLAAGPSYGEIWVIDTTAKRLRLESVAGGFSRRVITTSQALIEIAYDRLGGLLYGTTAGKLHSVDPITGATTEVMNLPGVEWIALEHDPISGLLIGTHPTLHRLYWIDPVAKTLTAAPQVVGGQMNDLGVDALSGTIYGVDTDGNIWTISRTTGQGTLIANVNPSSLAGLAIALVSDCNANTVPDTCDISSGHSTDCNGNGIPDECGSFCPLGFEVCDFDPACDMGAPPPPGPIAVTYSGPTSLALTWEPSANPGGVLAGYRVYIDGEQVAEVLEPDHTAVVEDLSPSQMVLVEVKAMNWVGGLSSPRSLVAYTAVPGPAGLAATPGHSSLALSWNSASPLSHLQSLLVFAESTAFGTVEGLQPKATLAPGATAFTLSGLQNGTAYWLAVATRNKSGGIGAPVAIIEASPLADTTGPTISNVRFAGQPLVLGGVVGADGSFRVDATDSAGVALVRFFVDGALLGVDSNPAGGWTAAFSPELSGDGPKELRVEAVDGLGNQSELLWPFVVAVAPPPPPALTAPAPNSAVNTPHVLVQGTGKAGALARAYVGGVAQPATATVTSAGTFSVLVPLSPGQNAITATLSNAGGESAPSASRQVLFDNTVPEAPKSLTAQPLSGGQVRLTWFMAGEIGPSGIAGYRIYRAAAPFTQASAATLLNNSLTTALAWTDVPPADGPWHYRVLVQNKAGTQSELSLSATATSDGTLPRVVHAEYSSMGGAHDPATGRFGVGTVKVEVEFSEPLLATPFFSLTPSGGLPNPVGLSKKPGSQLHYQGSFSISSSTPTGPALAVVSCRDLVGNRGTAIDSGQSLLIDTDAPRIVALTTDPPAPIRNDPDAPVVVNIEVELSEALPDGIEPELTAALQSSAPTPQLVELVQQSPTIWQGIVALSAQAGAVVENLTFAWLGEDDLGNQSTIIEGKSVFEVYQGALPALAAPLGLVAAAKPGGQIELNWQPVGGAAEYQVYRRPSGEGTFVPTIRTVSPTWLDSPPTEGAWTYAVASVRTHDGEESLSPLSAPAGALSDSTPPNPPENLTLLLASNGIFAQWTAPVPFTEPVTYALYRSTGLEIDSIEGLSPVVQGISSTAVVDPAPSLTAHAYAVVAVDAVGNRSAPSNSAYLNPGLLPPATLQVLHDVQAGPPVVSWTHPNANLQGFVVTHGGPIAPTDAPLQPQSPFVDTAYTPTPLRQYGVRAVDELGQESLVRSISLPAVQFAPALGSRLDIGVFTKVAFEVHSASALQGAVLEVQVGGKSYPSEPFGVQAGGSAVAEVVLPGLSQWGPSVALPASVRWNPVPSEQVKVVRPASFSTGFDTFALQVQPDALTRGATGQVRFVFHNPTAVPVEIELARQSGASPSTQVRVALVDGDGNVLATTSVKQITGAGVLTLANQITVARVPALGTFTSAWVPLAVPLAAPDQLNVRAIIDTVHYNLGKSDHASVAGLSSNTAVSLQEAPYRAVVTSVSPPTSQAGQPVIIAGHTESTATGDAVGNVPLTLFVSGGGFQRQYPLFSSPSGQFSFTFTPQAGEGGIYSSWANYPGLLNTAAQATFVVEQIVVSPTKASLTMAANYAYAIPAKVQTLPGTAPSQFRWVAPALPAGLSMLVPPPQDLAAGTTHSLPIQLSATPSAPSSGTFIVQAVSELPGGGSKVWGTMSVTYAVSSALPALVAKPTFLQTGVARGDMVTDTLALQNKGLVGVSELSLQLLNKAKNGPAPSWISITSGAQLGPIPPNGQAQVSLAAAPPASAALSLTEPTTAYLRVREGSQILADVPIYVWVNDSGLGQQLFKLSNIYTGTVKPGTNPPEVVLGLGGAKVKVDKVFGSPYSQTLTTDSAGEAFFASLPVGTYQYSASAAGHQSAQGTFVVKPGITGAADLFLSMPLVTVEWEVTEITISDKYEIILQATFETDVPAAVVVVEPPSVTIPDLAPGDIFYGEYTMTNHGLIRAEAMTVKLPPTDDQYKFELLGVPPTSLEAKEMVAVPYRIIRMGGSSGGAGGGSNGGGSSGGGSSGGGSEEGGDEGGGSGGGSEGGGSEGGGSSVGGSSGGGSSGGSGSTTPGSCGCSPYKRAVLHCYEFKCVNGQWQGGCAGISFVRVTGKCCPGSWTWVGGGGGGGGIIKTGPIPGSPGCDPCENPGLSADDKACCRMSKLQRAGSAVDLVTGEYSDEISDLKIAAFGGGLSLDRYYSRQKGWTFRYMDADLQIELGLGAKDHILHLGVRYDKADAAGTVFAAGSVRIRAVDAPSGVAWRWEDTSGRWRHFANNGRLMAFGEQSGASFALVRNAQGRLLSIEDTAGQTLVNWQYDGSGRPIEATAHDGRQIVYTWTSGRLTQMSAPGGRTCTYTYDGQGRLLSKAFENGKKYTIAYSGNSAVASVIDESGVGQYFNYGYNQSSEQNYAAALHTSGSLTEKWFDKSGAVVAEAHDGVQVPVIQSQQIPEADNHGNLVGISYLDGLPGPSWQYGSDHRLIRRTDERGIATEFTYDAQGRPVREVRGAGRADAQTTDFVWGTSGELLEIIEVGLGQEPDFVTTLSYDAFGNVSQVQWPDGSIEYATWDSAGRVLSWQRPEGTLTYEYDAAGRQTLRRFVTAGETEGIAETAVHSIWLNSAGQPAGREVAYTDALGQTWIARLDPDDRLRQQVDPFGRVESWTYDDRGRLVSYTDIDGVLAEVQYEATEQGTRETTRVQGQVVSVLELDPLGRPLSETAAGRTRHFIYEGAKAAPVQVLTDGLVELLTTDGRNKVRARQVLLDAQAIPGARFSAQTLEESFDFAGRLPSGYSGPSGAPIELELDLFGAPQVRRRAGGIEQTWVRDSQGRLVALVGADAAPTVVIEYDAGERPIRRELGSGASFDYAYDAAGDLAERASSGGRRVVTERDWQGLPTDIRLYAAASDEQPEDTIVRQYDVLGRLTSASNAEADRTISREPVAQSESEIVIFAGDPTGPTFQTTRWQNPRGETIAIALSDGSRVDYSWGPDGVVEQVVLEHGGVSWTFMRTTPHPYATVWTLPGGATYTQHRDPLGNVVALVAQDAQGTVLLEWEYERTGSQIDAIDTGSGRYEYTYDNYGRLVGATYPSLPPESFAYDSRGNRIAGGPAGQGPHQVGAGDLLMAAGSESFTYGPHGELVQSQGPNGALTFEWDAAEQLSRVLLDGPDNGIELAQYGYDDEGRRVRKVVGGQTTYFVWSEEGLLAELDAQGALTKHYGWLPNTERQSAPIFYRVGPEVYSVLADESGAPIALLDETGALVWTAERRAFGEYVIEPGPLQDFALRGSSHFVDFETGLHYGGYRTYAPHLGRYLSPEPLFELAAVQNLYAFADNDPIGRVDRDGLTSSPANSPSTKAGSARSGSGVQGRAGYNWGSNSFSGDLGRSHTIDRESNSRASGGARGSYRDPGNWSAGVHGSVGGGVGAGGSASGGFGYERRDCCIRRPGEPTRIIRGGQSCGYAEAGFEAFAGGVAARGGVAGAGAKLASANGSRRCRTCNACGGSSEVSECCNTAGVKIGSGDVSIGRFRAEASVANWSRTRCTGSYEGVDDRGLKSSYFGGSVSIGPAPRQ